MTSCSLIACSRRAAASDMSTCAPAEVCSKANSEAALWSSPAFCRVRRMSRRPGLSTAFRRRDRTNVGSSMRNVPSTSGSARICG